MRSILFLLTILCAAVLSAAPLKLAENGKTDYTIVVPANASEVNKYAANELAFFLKEITGVQFPVAATAKGPAIYVGAAKTKLADDVSQFCSVIIYQKSRLSANGIFLQGAFRCLR